MHKRATIEWNAAQSLAANAKAKLPPLVCEYFAEGRKAAAPEATPQEMHQFRLRTKRLRYTLELFKPCYGPGLESRITLLRGIQDTLGDLNDCATTLEMLGSYLPEDSPRRKAAEQFLGASAETHANAFRAYWQDEFDRPKRERWWTNYLGKAAEAAPKTSEANRPAGRRAMRKQTAKRT